MTRIDVATQLACSAEQAWGLLTDPDLKTIWSASPFHVEDVGEDDRCDRAGALREVEISAPLRTRVHEVVTVADEPHRLDYMVYKGAPLLRDHHGRIDIETTPAGCAVRWTVDVSFTTKLGKIATPTLRREMEKSLAGLSEQSKLMPPPAAVTARRPHPRRPRRSPASVLRPEVDRQLGHQRLIADEFARTGDPKYWLARSHVLANEEALALVDARVIENPDWLLHLMSNQHRRYVSNLHAYRTGGPISPVWRSAWARCEETSPRRAFGGVLGGIRAGSRAHLAEDTPAALAEVWGVNYRDTRHYKEFRADFIRLGSLHGTCGDRLIDELPADLVPRPLRLARRLSPELRDMVVRRLYYDVEVDRMRAFDRGYDIARRTF
ncbi:DUF5995 family protein [Williamsia phyllosphaerae]|uniref:Polyketide cyclase / dehydrase and lipid transport n=1 Tax=Williamsia phyllosphaerae TaxID=885042 RepID=A0ABQ1V0N8_9NOCA|nr:DUF5995 family protein [Williamsia phyllosphaerae]GGF32740.1 hypothetical protein GCM10007298_30800 [Williamsia phyllosphaerae]